MPEETTWTRPEGGMSIWVTLPPGFDAGELLIHVRERGVLFVPGRYFYLQNPQPNTLRLGFASLDEKTIARGVQTLSELLRIEFASASAASPQRIAFAGRAGLVCKRKDAEGAIRPIRPENACFGCGGGESARHAAHVRAGRCDASASRHDFALARNIRAARAFIHGGIIALLLDEAMGKVSRFTKRSRRHGRT